MKVGKIIFLNGPSSSGKASIAKALQSELPEPYLYFSVDSLLHMLPEQLMSDSGEDIAAEDEQTLNMLITPLMSAIHHSIQVFADHGVNLIVDHVIQRQDWLEECVDLLSDYPVLFVGVHCSLEELERRERGKSGVTGLAKLQLDVVHAHEIYDLEVDTCVDSSVDCAAVIQRALQQGDLYFAFPTLKTRFSERSAS